jgi:hypothetical protein
MIVTISNNDEVCSQGCRLAIVVCKILPQTAASLLARLPVCAVKAIAGKTIEEGIEDQCSIHGQWE